MAAHWPPPCPDCAGDPARVAYCEGCACEGTAIDWQCASCAQWIGVDDEPPAEVREHAGRVAYTCGDCASAPTLDFGGTVGRG